MMIKFLGTGTSHGVPVPGCKCDTCTSDDPRNTRYRTSLYVKYEGCCMLIDTPPEHRLQMIEYGPVTPDIILFTHEHADHIMGFDDIRTLNWRKNGHIDCYSNRRTKERIEKIFSYMFSSSCRASGGLPRADLHEIDDLPPPYNSFIEPLNVLHGKSEVLGYRIGPAAYITDVSEIPSKTRNMLAGIELLILGVLRREKHPTHLSLREAIELVDELDVPAVYFVNMSHKLEHKSTNRELPDHINLAFDGLKLEL